jgi:hypothetical protein
MFAALVTPVASVLHGMAHASDGERHGQLRDPRGDTECAARDRAAQTAFEAADHDHEVHAALHLADARIDAELVPVADYLVQSIRISAPTTLRVSPTAFSRRAPAEACHQLADLARAPPAR